MRYEPEDSGDEFMASSPPSTVDTIVVKGNPKKHKRGLSTVTSEQADKKSRPSSVASSSRPVTSRVPREDGDAPRAPAKLARGTLTYLNLNLANQYRNICPQARGVRGTYGV